MTHSLAESLGGGSPIVWAGDWLKRAALPVTEENVRAVVSWEYAESAAGGGMWNPLNTTQGGYPGESDANGVGVKNYATRDDGLAANAKVIHNGLYPNVLAAFHAGDSAQAVVNAIVVSPWGTRYIRLVGPLAPPPTVPNLGVPDMPQVIACPAGGYWECHADGSVYAYGGANYYGGAHDPKSTPHPPPAGERITSMAATPSGKGYYQLGEHGWLGTYGDAHFAGTQPA